MPALSKKGNSRHARNRRSSGRWCRHRETDDTRGHKGTPRTIQQTNHCTPLSSALDQRLRARQAVLLHCGVRLLASTSRTCAAMWADLRRGVLWRYVAALKCGVGFAHPNPTQIPRQAELRARCVRHAKPPIKKAKKKSGRGRPETAAPPRPPPAPGARATAARAMAARANNSRAPTSTFPRADVHTLRRHAPPRPPRRCDPTALPVMPSSSLGTRPTCSSSRR